MALLLSGALVLDYQREVTHRVAERRLAFDEEAKTIAAAIPVLSHHGPQAIQNFLDAVCGSLSESDSPGHHLALHWEGTVFQPTVHGRASTDLFDAIRDSAQFPDGRSQFAGQEIVVASKTMAGGGTVFVSGSVTGIRKLVLKENLSRFLGLLLAGTVAAVVANIVLVRRLAQPLERLVSTVGQIAQGGLGLQADRFRTAELATLAAAINEMSLTLAANDAERNRQLEKARRLQEHLLRDWPEVPGLSIERLFQPATVVTGDYTDLAIGPDGCAVLCIADVSGHGIPAAMEAAMLKTLFLSAVGTTSHPAEVLKRLNAEFTTVMPLGDFASMFVLRWDPRKRIAEYASAGHEPSWLCQGGGNFIPLRATGSLLGVHTEGEWSSHSIPIAPGDRLLLLTDGVTECADPHGELFGRNRIRPILQLHSRSPVSESVAALNRQLEEHREGQAPQDDVTIVFVEFRKDYPSTEEEQRQ